MAKSTVKKTKARPAVKKAKKQPPKPKKAKSAPPARAGNGQAALKKALANFATREEIANLASRAELAGFPSREDWNRLDQKVESLEYRLDTMDKKIELLANQVQEGSSASGIDRINGELMQIREVVSNLELKSAEAKAFEHSLVQHEERLNDLDVKIRNMEGTG